MGGQTPGVNDTNGGHATLEAGGGGGHGGGGGTHRLVLTMDSIQLPYPEVAMVAQAVVQAVPRRA